jgi:hypothetical protein
MASECFAISSRIESANQVMNEGSIVCIALACLMTMLVILGLYFDNKKPVSKLKKVPGTRNNIFVQAEESKEFEESIDNDGSKSVA